MEANKIIRDIDKFSRTINTLNKFNKVERTIDDNIDIEDSLVDQLLDSMVGKINPGVKTGLIVALSHLISFLHEIRVISYNNKIYLCKNGDEALIYNNKATSLPNYLVLDECSIGIKVAHSFVHHDLKTNLIDIVRERNNDFESTSSLEGIVSSFDRNGIEIHRCISEAAKPNSPNQFERTETYDRDPEDFMVVHVKREAINYLDDYVANDEFTVLTALETLDVDLEKIHRDRIVSKVLK